MYGAIPGRGKHFRSEAASRAYSFRVSTSAMWAMRAASSPRVFERSVDRPRRGSSSGRVPRLSSTVQPRVGAASWAADPSVAAGVRCITGSAPRDRLDCSDAHVSMKMLHELVDGNRSTHAISLSEVHANQLELLDDGVIFGALGDRRQVQQLTDSVDGLDDS